jgi:hypothetical protein
MKIELNAVARLASVKVTASPLKAMVTRNLTKHMKSHNIRAEFHTVGENEILMVVLGTEKQFDSAKHIMDLIGDFKYVKGKDDLTQSKYNWWSAEYLIH